MAMNTANLCMWVEYRVSTVYRIRDVAVAVCSDVYNGSTIASVRLLQALCTRCGTVPEKVRLDVLREPLVTWDHAVSLIAAALPQLTVCDPVGMVPSGPRRFHPNPFLADVVEPHTTTHADFGSKTLETFRDESGLTAIHVATIDDVRSHFKTLKSSQAAATNGLPYFFPDSSSSLMRVDETSDVDAALCRVKVPTVITTLHIEVRRSEWLRHTASMRLQVESLRDLFTSVPVSSAYQVARIIDRSKVRHRVHSPSIRSAMGPDLVRLLQAHPLRSGDSSQLALFGIRSWLPKASMCWCVTLTPVEGGGARIEVFLTRGSVPLADVEGELRRIRADVIDRLAVLSGWDGFPCLDVAAWSRESVDGGLSQRLVNCVASASIKAVDAIAPSAAALATALASPKAAAFIGQLQRVSGTLLGQYCRASMYHMLTLPQQTIRMNSTAPPHIIIGMLVERHKLDRRGAQTLLEEELSKREHYGLHQPTLIVAKPSHDLGIALTVRGVTDIVILPRIFAIIAEAASAVGPGQDADDGNDGDNGDDSHDGYDGYDGHDGNDDTQLPSELNDVLSQGSHAFLEGDAGPGSEAAIPGRYVISELHRADASLFDTTGKEKLYSRICGHVNLRQPIRVSPKEIDRIERAFPGSLTGTVATGSTPDAVANNRYICPKVWCPKSRVAMTLEQYDANGKRCPNPDIREEALVFDSESYWKGRDRHPGFLDPKFHPDGLCMPCCFLKPGRKKSRCATSSSGGEAESMSNARYIYSDNTVLPDGRFGFLPPTLHTLLNAGSPCAKHVTTHLTNRTSCILRKGVASSQHSLFDCVAMVLGISSGRALVELVRAELDPRTFLTLHQGAIATAFLPRSLTTALADPIAVQSFVEWFTNLTEDRIEGFQLREVHRAVVSGLFQQAIAAGVGSSKDLAVLQATREYALFLSLHAYLAALEKARTHELLLDLINVAPGWLNPRRIYLIIVKRDSVADTDYTVSCPVKSAAGTRRDPERVAFLVQQGDHYEALCRVTGIRGAIDESFSFDAQRVPGARALLSMVASTCMHSVASPNDARAASVVRAMRMLQEPAAFQVIDYRLKCVGFLTATGMYVPLSRPDAILPSQLRAIYVEDAMRLMKDDASIERERNVSAFFMRLAAMTTDSAFEVVRVLERPGAKSILLKMGKTVPLSIDDEIKARYMTHINAFVNVSRTDKRVVDVTTNDALDARVTEAHHRYLAAVQASATSLNNLVLVVAPACTLPWDVKHRYIAWSVSRYIGAERTLAAEVADRILLGVRLRGSSNPRPVDDDVVELDDDVAELSQRTATTETPACPNAEPHSVDLSRTVDNFPLDVIPSAASALDGLRSKGSSLTARASVQARTLLKSMRSLRSRKKKRVEMISVPLTRDVAIDVIYHANSVLHHDAPVSKAALAVASTGSDVMTGLQAMSKLFDVPLALFQPESGSSYGVDEHSLGRANDMVVLVSTNTDTGGHDVILTRERHEVFAVLTSHKLLTDPSVTFVPSTR